MATSGLSQSISQSTTARPRNKWQRMLDRWGDLTVEYWAHGVTVILGVLVFSALAVPFLSYFGLNFIAKPIFFSLHHVCAQIPSHSFYIFGHQLGFCARNLAIYASMFIGSLIFVLSKKRLPGIPWWLWILMMLPMAWDGFTQMFGWRESDWILRLVTGSLFGFGNIWFAMPMMQKTIDTPVTPVPAHYSQLPQQRLSFPWNRPSEPTTSNRRTHSKQVTSTSHTHKSSPANAMEKNEQSSKQQ